MKKLTIILITLLSAQACNLIPWKRDNAKKEPATIASLEKKEIPVQGGKSISSTRDQAIESYRKFLQSAKNNRYRAEAQRRIADLEMENAEARLTRETQKIALRKQQENYERIIKMYENLLRTQPNYKDNDVVLYQLAKAHEQSGKLEASLEALTRLVKQYPQSRFYTEAQFRRAEILFVLKKYRNARDAYQAVLKRGKSSPFYERAIYKHGWAEFKLGLYKEGLKSFFTLLDIKLRNPNTGQIMEDRPGLSRGDRELLQDSFRVISLSFSYLDGHASITRFFKSYGDRPYIFRIYRHLGDLYIKQERIKDAADTYNAFVRNYPEHDYAPEFQAQVIKAYQKGGFLSLTLQAKEEFVNRYNKNSRFWKVHNEKARARIEPLLKSNIEELARYYHAQAQKQKDPAKYRKPASLYRMYTESFPKDPKTPQMHFLLAEALYAAHDYHTAAIEYENAAYRYSKHAKSAEAGYAALLAFRKYETGLSADRKKAFHQRTIESGLKFANHFPTDKRAPAVLTQAAEDLFKAGQNRKAAQIATRVVTLQPPAANDLRRTAWTVIAHTQFMDARYAEAEKSYSQVLLLTSTSDKRYKPIHDRMVASVYKQGEALRNAGFHREAVKQFLRIGSLDPKSEFRPNAEYDAAASLMELKEWNRAAAVLEAFRRNFPRHPLTKSVPEKLTFIYISSKQPARAARELDNIANTNKDRKYVQQARWQAAELYEKAGNRHATIEAYKRYVKQFPRPLEQAMEARNKIALLYKQEDSPQNYHYWLNEMIKADRHGGAARTARTRYLAAQSSYILAKPSFIAFKRARLTIPLKRSLRTKKRLMQKAIKAYENVASYKISEYTTAATYWIGEIYSTFGRDLMKSDRPRGLKKDELEQYSILLEEQAYPFEEKAIQFHQINLQRTSNGIFDEWVQKSLARLAKLRPIQYAKPEKTEVISREIR